MPLGQYFCVVDCLMLTSLPCPQVTIVIIDIDTLLHWPFSPLIELAVLFRSTIIGNAFRPVCWWRCSPDAHIIAAPCLHHNHGHLLTASQRVGHIIQSMQQAVSHGNDTVNCLVICWILILAWSIHTTASKDCLLALPMLLQAGLRSCVHILFLLPNVMCLRCSKLNTAVRAHPIPPNTKLARDVCAPVARPHFLHAVLILHVSRTQNDMLVDDPSRWAIQSPCLLLLSDPCLC